MGKIQVQNPKIRLGDYESSIGEVLIEREKLEKSKFPDVDLRDSITLKEGDRAYKCANHWVIRDRNSGEEHHHAVTIETYRRYKAGWEWDETHSITLEDDGTDEIEPLVTFLSAVKGKKLPDGPGQYLVVPVDGRQIKSSSLQQLLTLASSDSKADLIIEALAMAKGDAESLRALAAKAAEDSETSKNAAAALNAANFQVALDELLALMESDALEGKYQTLLTKNPWMFGSEYSDLLDRREWSRGQVQDFVVRRTTDRYLEIIEIKTPLEDKPLFLYDPSHETYFPRRELSAVLGQVMHYLETLDKDRDRIKAGNNEDVTKIRAKIIIGKDGGEDQRAALRRLNGHLHRIEVITFDQLAATAKQVLKHLIETP